MSNTQPTLITYTVKERGEGRKAIWTKIGAVFPHDKGKGMTIQLDACRLGTASSCASPKTAKPIRTKGVLNERPLPLSAARVSSGKD
jgi:hypothetical protein